MTDINVVSKTQKIIVDPASSSVSVINAGPIGPGGSDGADGIGMGTGVTDVEAITQAAYDALSPPDATTIYLING